MVGQVWWFDSLLDKYGNPPFLGPDICSIHHGRRNGYPLPRLNSTAESEAFCWSTPLHYNGESLLRLLALPVPYICPSVGYELLVVPGAELDTSL